MYNYTRSITIDVSGEPSHIYLTAKQYDKQSRYLSINITKDGEPLTLLEGTQARIRCIKPDGYSVLNDCTIEGGKVIAEITEQMLAAKGIMVADLGLYAADGSLLSTSTFFVDVDTAMNQNQIESTYEANALTTAMAKVGDAESISETALVKSEEALENLEVLNAAEQSRVIAESSRVSAESARVTADAGRTEKVENAEDAAEEAAQALTDMLSMLGTDIATLGPDGKLSPSQVPPIAINDTFPVPDTAAMLALTAQRGDVAVIVVSGTPNDSYILMTEDPTNINNWQKLGISYVAEAGHAQTASSAEDASRINGKRIVSMTQTQYDIALSSGTLEDNALYVVTPDES